MDQQSEADISLEPSIPPKPSSPTSSEFSSQPRSAEEESLTPTPVLGVHSTQQPVRSSSYSLQLEAHNGLAPLTVNLLPEEILIDIFFLLMNHASPGSPLERSLERTIRSSYKQLFILISVCSEWRRICLSRGTFWSLISVCKHWREPESVLKLCLERLHGSEIHLDGELGDVPDHKLIEIITEYGPRIRTLNIHGENPEALRNAVTSCLEHTEPGCMPNLFIRNYQMILDDDSHHTWPFLYPIASPEHMLLNGFTDSLSTLRLCGFQLDWSQTGFSKLVELKVQRICFHSLSEIADLMHAIASAPQLTKLQLIDLRCHLDDIHTLHIDQPANLPVLHPSLQSIFLKNLRWALLTLIIRSMIHGSYKIVIGYSGQREYLVRYTADLTLLKESVLQNINIDRLMISGNWVQRSDILRSLLKAMPTLKGLSIAHCDFTKKTFQAIIRPLVSDADDSEGDFPTIPGLHILGSAFELLDLEELKEVVTSHGTQELKLGGSIDELKADHKHTSTLEHSVRFEDPADDEHTAPIKGWLHDNVPKLTLVRMLDDLPDFDFQSYNW